MKLYKRQMFWHLDNIKRRRNRKSVINFLNKINPDILVITGHDAYYKK